MLSLRSAQNRRFHFLLVLYVISLSFVPLSWAVEPCTVDSASPHAGPPLPQRIIESLQPNGMLLNADNNGVKISFAEVFWVKKLSAQKPEANNFNDLKLGSFIGVIRILPEAGDEYREDFHDQKLRPGYYTLRYGLLPGNVFGVVVLSPVRLDNDATYIPTVDELISLGQQASHTSQPAVMSFGTPELGNILSPAIQTEEGACVAQVQLPLTLPASGGKTLKLAIILVKATAESDGS